MDYEYHTVSWAEWLESVRKDVVWSFENALSLDL